MKNLMLVALLLFSVSLYGQENQKKDSISQIDLKEVVISSTRASEKTPMTFNTLQEEEIQANNMGKDIPYILELTPSAVVTSDAGAGVGYTGIRIRGSDATRVNITLNGIPYNDSESQGTFWVNLPDIASSVSSIQVQRGVGTSTNGAGAFGASVNIETTGLNKEPYATLDNAFGSFNTRKHTAMFGTGLINDKFAFDGRASKISSDGYIDRASSELSSFFLSGGYYGKKSLVKFNVFSGKEITYQSWYGTHESRVNNDLEGMNAYAARNFLSPEDTDRLINSSRTYNEYTYENEVDNYQQTHYQLISAFDISDVLTFNFALHLTHGEGYFEQFRNQDDLSEYGLDNVVIGANTIESTDLVRRRWLDNNFYGTTFSLNYRPNQQFNIQIGGAWNEYDGDHFGELIWAQYSSNGSIRHRYYDNNGFKTDFNLFAKANWSINDNLSFYGDLQYRTLDYKLLGIDNDLLFLDQSHDYNFVNPKFGFRYQTSQQSSVYASFAVGNKEPSRSDFTDNPTGTTPKHETLNDIEIGYQINTEVINFKANAYYMFYKNQLVLTGDLNDVGSSLRANVDKSYRRGVELQIGYLLTPALKINANATFSQNKIEQFNDVIYNYGLDWSEYEREEEQLTNTDIAFSPNIITAGSIEYLPTNGLRLTWLHKYVGKQFLDNTSNDQRSIDAYYISDFIVNFPMQIDGLFESLEFKLGVYNVFNKLYSANGYSWGYRGGGEEIRENFYYPQAGTNFMVGLLIKL